MRNFAINYLFLNKSQRPVCTSPSPLLKKGYLFQIFLITRGKHWKYNYQSEKPLQSEKAPLICGRSHLSIGGGNWTNKQSWAYAINGRVVKKYLNGEIFLVNPHSQVCTPILRTCFFGTTFFQLKAIECFPIL